MKGVGRPATAGERNAERLLFSTALLLIGELGNGAFPVHDDAIEELIARIRNRERPLFVVRPGGLWPARLVDEVAVLFPHESSCVLLLTEMLRVGAFEDLETSFPNDDPAMPEILQLVVWPNGKAILGPSLVSNRLFALAPQRADS